MNAGFIVALVVCAIALPTLTAAERNYYTDAKVAVMRRNLTQHEWAGKKRDEIFRAADHWARYDDATLRTLVIPPGVPRGYQVHNFGCPVHGIEVHKTGLYKWIIDFDKPYTVKCPVGGEEYPSNDFAAFLASGMRDRTLLTGPYADDGWGWNKEGDDTNYWFVAYYAHWTMRRQTLPAIQDLGVATVLAEVTDPERACLYAHKCALLLWQLAEYYPDYEYEKQSREAKEHNPNYTGRLTNMIWEVDTPRRCAPAYDAVRPYLADDRELQDLSGLSGLEIDGRIRDRLLMQAARDITSGNGRIRGNYGAHQRALIELAISLAETKQHPTSAEMIDWVLANPDPKEGSDVGLMDALENLVYRDGMPLESIGYNYLWVSYLADIASALADAGTNLFGEPRLQRLLTWPFDVVACGEFVPPLGDTGDMFARGSGLSPSVARLVLPHFPDPRIAAVVRDSAGAGHDLFAETVDEIGGEMPEVDAGPTHFPAYGLAYLRANGDRTAGVLSYGDYPAHCHRDQLNLLLFAHGNAMLTDIGYPEQTDSRNHKRFAFFSNTVAHNTVVVDARKQGRGPGRLHAYEPNGPVQVVDASCEGAYEGVVSLYRRANILVALPPTDSYLFDVFYVRGGNQHDYVALGPPSEFSAEPALGPVQEMGTLAGENVEYESFYDDERYAAGPLGSMAYGGYEGSGFQYLFNVRRARIEGRAVGEWRLTKPTGKERKHPWEGIGLRAHLLGTDEELIACEGKPQKYEYMPDEIQFMIRRRVGEELASRFVTVYEPYEQTPPIRRVSPVALSPDDGDAAAARIDLIDGTTHYAFHSLAPKRAYTLDGTVQVAAQAAWVAVDATGSVSRASMLNGLELVLGDFRLEGEGLRESRVVSVDYREGVVEIADPILEGVGRDQTVLVEPEGFADCLTVQAVIDDTHFSIGDEDVVVAGGPVKEVITGENRIVTHVEIPHAQPGMTVLNGENTPVGRVAAGRRLTVDRANRDPLIAADFPGGAGGLDARFRVAMVGPGDLVCIPHLAVFDANGAKD